MRYWFYISVLLSDVLVLISLVFIWLGMPIWFSLLMTILAFRVWNTSGGFMAWQPKWIKKFLTNTKELGL